MKVKSIVDKCILIFCIPMMISLEAVKLHEVIMVVIFP